MPVREVRDKPPAPKEKEYIRLYTSSICPFAERVHLFLAAKGVKAEYIYISLQNKPEWYLEIYPKGQVPFFEQNGHRLGESAIICEYLDEKYGDKKLYPTDPWQKALVKEFVDAFGTKFLGNWYKNYRGGATDETNAVLGTFLQEMEDRLKQPNHPFLFGQEVTAADLLTWPWFERLEAGLTLFPKVSELVLKEKYSSIYAWIERMKMVDAVKECAISTEAHLKFLKSMKDKHDYDVLGKDFDLYVKSSE
jgi:glutathione S-transferase